MFFIFKSLITGKTSYNKQHCPADGVGVDKLLLIHACIYIKSPELLQRFCIRSLA
jgi:hypothetical protein